MSLFAAPAKINLRLRVLAREIGGWHQIESLFCRLDLADEIEIETGSSGVTLEVDGPDTGPLRDNLVWRAACAFFDAAGIAPAARIRLTKRIPARAGLGGGSSDAATTLNALNGLFGRPLGRDQVRQLGAALGSDVPFFLSDVDFALVWGRGERVLPLPAPPSMPVVVVAPRDRIATADAYARFDAGRAHDAQRLEAVVLEDFVRPSWDAILTVACNDFEPVADAMLVAVPVIRRGLREAGARLAQLTGSGSAVFGIFDDAARATAAARALTGAAPAADVFVTRTADRASG